MTGTSLFRYCQQKWDQAHKATATQDTRRATRLCRVSLVSKSLHLFLIDHHIDQNPASQLRQKQTKVALDEQALWPLVPLIEVACSDDETDVQRGSACYAR